jgi:hypothetical protein
MGLIQTIFGKGDAKKADALETIADVSTALDLLNQERETARVIVAEAATKRREMLLVVDSDKKIAELEAAADAARLMLERLDAAEEALHARIFELQSAERRALFASMVDVFREKESALDTALAAAVDAQADYREIVRQFDAASFSAEARNVIISPPLYHDGVLASGPTLENWRRERERVADLRAANESRKVHQSSQASAPYKASKFIPPFSVAPKPIPRKIAPAPAPMSVKRAPKHLSGPVPFGYQRVECQMNNVSFENQICVIGDQFDVMKEAADIILKGSAFILIAIPESIDEAAP